uniref:ATP synthase complex subunit 8 n=1 Tax=Xenophora japonica TaxID=2821805 RepID=A0A8A6KKF9_9CAEN|nr:ATP synthase F0 subunit 8 [Xenophora japonica]QTI82482.1 ATP synthase F0 subunit 8 [Xenophora japonica]
MPQLSPLNWIFLFILFWLAVISVSILIWWVKKVYFQTEPLSSKGQEENKWNW